MGVTRTLHGAPVSVFTTCPSFDGAADHPRRIEQVARWSEEWGCEGILVYTDNGQLDPWLVSQAIVASTATLSPVVAVQPLYMHPYSVAKLVASVAALHRRRMHLNMVAGGFRNDLLALGDDTAHDCRYERLVEYTSIVRGLLAGDEPVTYSGRYYCVRNLRLEPRLPAGLEPGFLVSGSSASGLAAAGAIGATAVRYPEPIGEEELPIGGAVDHGIRVGVIARGTEAAAWSAARARFPEDRRGQIAHQMAMKVTDSSWHRVLSDRAGREARGSPYWLVPFENYKTFCPYLVGSYETVAAELARFLAGGCSTVILDVPSSGDDLRHTARAFSLAFAGSVR